MGFDEGNFEAQESLPSEVVDALDSFVEDYPGFAFGLQRDLDTEVTYPPTSPLSLCEMKDSGVKDFYTRNLISGFEEEITDLENEISNKKGNLPWDDLVASEKYSYLRNMGGFVNEDGEWEKEEYSPQELIDVYTKLFPTMNREKDAEREILRVLQELVPIQESLENKREVLKFLNESKDEVIEYLKERRLSYQLRNGR